MGGSGSGRRSEVCRIYISAFPCGVWFGRTPGLVGDLDTTIPAAKHCTPGTLLAHCPSYKVVRHPYQVRSKIGLERLAAGMV